MTDDKVYSQLVDDLFTSLDKEVGAVLEGVVPNGAASLKVYLVKHNHGYGDYYYNSFVVVAVNEGTARTTHPSGDNSQ